MSDDLIAHLNHLMKNEPDLLSKSLLQSGIETVQTLQTQLKIASSGLENVKKHMELSNSKSTLALSSTYTIVTNTINKLKEQPK